MRRCILGLAALAFVLPAAGAHAAQTGTALVVQSYNFGVGRNLPGGGYENFSFYASNSTGGTLAGSTVTPSTDFKAQANSLSCNASYVCTEATFNTQQVAPTALSIDPLGNSIHFVACLAPSTGGPCRNFDVTATRPSGTSQCLACTQVPNVWFDPSGNMVGGSLYVFSGLQRYGYTIAGTFNGAPLAADLYGSDYFGEYASAIVTATAP
jgi:hypothetical protein